MSQDDPQQPKPPLAPFEIPEWFQESEDDRVAEEEALGRPVGLPDIFDDQTEGESASPSLDRSATPEIAAAIQEWQRQPGQGQGGPGRGGPQEESAPETRGGGLGVPMDEGLGKTSAGSLNGGLAEGLGSKAERLAEIAEAIALMAGTLRHWPVEGAAGAALILSSLAAELSALARADHPLRASGKDERIT